jgi:hypothetical protein
MKKILTLLFAVGMGFSFNSFAHSQGALNQMTSGTLSEGSDDAKLDEKDVNLKAYRPFNAILEKMGFDKVNILISKQKAESQEKRMKKGLPFKVALQEVFEDIMIDNAKKDGLYQTALKKAYEKLKMEPQQKAPKVVLKETVKILKAGINSGETEIRLFSLPKVADRGESTRTNWVFHLHVPQISSKGFFIIVDKNEKRETMNYESFISYHNADMSGEINAAPEIESNQKPAANNTPASDSELAEAGNSAFDGAAFDERSDALLTKGSEVTIGSIRNQGKILYDNYGAQFTMVKYDAWPGRIPIYGDFAVPYKNYLANARKIDTLRIDTRDLWIKLNENVTPEQAQVILVDMKKMGREYDRLVGECLKYVRQGQQLHSEGKATFPSLLHNIKLVKGSTYIDLYDDNGKQITKKKCAKWDYEYSYWGSFTSFYGMGGSAYKLVCVEYKYEPVKAKVPDYYLEYGYGGDQIYPHRARMMDVPPTPAFPEIFLQESVKRDQYDMEVIVACELDEDPNKGWLIKEAKLRKGKANWGNSAGISGTVGGKVGIPLVAEGSVSVSVNAGLTWSHFRFGDMVDFHDFVGKPCFELNKGR